MNLGEGPDQSKGQSGILRAALLGSCPKCKQPTLFETPAQFALRCSHCDLDFGAIERGGRLAGLVTALIAVVLILLAYAVEATLRPPLWLQAAFWAPVTVGAVIYSLRLYKTLALYAAFERSADQKDHVE